MHADPSKQKKSADRSLRLVPNDEKEITLHISLSDIEPLIWRRLQVSDAMTLHELHLLIQGAFGWQNNHLHSFIIKQGEAYSSRSSAFDEDEGGDSRLVHLRDIVRRPIKSFRYVYDMGDNWMHRIRVESVLSLRPQHPLPQCIDGARQGPPEDCGGALGYEELLENPPQRFDPEHFSLRQANARMKKMLNGKSP